MLYNSISGHYFYSIARQSFFLSTHTPNLGKTPAVAVHSFCSLYSRFLGFAPSRLPLSVDGWRRGQKAGEEQIRFVLFISRKRERECFCSPPEMASHPPVIIISGPQKKSGIFLLESSCPLSLLKTPPTFLPLFFLRLYPQPVIHLGCVMADIIMDITFHL